MHLRDPGDGCRAPIGAGAASLDRLSCPPVFRVAEIDVVSGRYLRAIPRLAAWVGATSEEVVRLDLRCVLHPDDWAADVDQRRRLAEGEVSECTAPRRFMRRDAAVTSTMVSVSALWAPEDPPESVLLLALEPLDPSAGSADAGARRQSAELLVAAALSNVRLQQAVQRELAERTRMEGEPRRLEWMRSKEHAPAAPATDSAGSRLVAINRCRVLLDAAGKEMLDDIAGDFLDLLDSAAAVYEKNGDYALGRHSSRWCSFLHENSRRIWVHGRRDRAPGRAGIGRSIPGESIYDSCVC